jgi:hypothetical protein
MPCATWSLEARKTCPGSVDPVTKESVPVCEGCYASYGFYKMPASKKIRINNRKDWQRKEWVSEMIEAINTQKPDKQGKRYFRWFDSGDIYHPNLAVKILEVMKGTPKVKHWLPTRSYKIPKIRETLEEMKLLPNVMVRYSSDSITGEHGEIHGSVVIPDHDFKIKAKKCDAYERDGKCGDCRACWSKSVKLIAYSAHGVKMKTVVKKHAA